MVLPTIDLLVPELLVEVVGVEEVREPHHQPMEVLACRGHGTPRLCVGIPSMDTLAVPHEGTTRCPSARVAKAWNGGSQDTGMRWEGPEPLAACKNDDWRGLPAS